MTDLIVLVNADYTQSKRSISDMAVIALKVSHQALLGQ